MFASRLKTAFALTAPHPLDHRVRIAHTPKALAAIFAKEVRAVIWKRDLPDHLATDFDAMDFGRINGQRSLRTPHIKSTAWGTKVMRLADAEMLSLPPSILSDMCEISNQYRRALGRLQYETAKFLDLVNCYNFTGQWTGREFAKAASPHIDGVFCPRLITSYATNPDMGTVWYPGNFSGKALYDLQDRLAKASDPEEMLRAFDARHCVQSISPGDVMLIKGIAKGVSQNELLTHRAATPAIGARRATLVIS